MLIHTRVKIVVRRLHENIRGMTLYRAALKAA